jgi:hypothetical protein
MGPSLGKEFSSDINRLARRIEAWGTGAPKEFERSHRKIGERFKQEAKQRVPVDESRVKNAILANTYSENGEVITEVGTNVQEYPIYIEFGTERIAGGRVAALGDDIGITDADAVKLWPAKNRDIVDETTGKANTRVVNALQKGFDRGRPQEQMPWLRPSFEKIRVWAVALLIAALQPPGGGTKQGAA